MKNKNDKKVQLEYFNHITNTSARQHATIAKVKFDRSSLHLPSKENDLIISETQDALLMPTQRTMYMGFIIDDAIGDRAMKRIAKRKIDMMTGNVSGYAWWVNSEKDVKKYK